MSMSLSEAIAQANNYLKAGDKQQAIRLLEPLSREHPQEGRVWALLAMATDEPLKKRHYLDEVLKLSTSPKVVEWAHKEIDALRPAVPVEVRDDPLEPMTFIAAKSSKGVLLVNLLAGVAILLLVGLVALVAIRIMGQNRGTVTADVPTEEAAMTVSPSDTPTLTVTVTTTPTASPTITATLTITPAPTATLSEVDLIVQQGEELRMTLKFVEAVEVYTSAIALDPNSIPAYIGRTRSYFGLQMWDEAFADIDMIRQIDPTHPESYILEGRYEQSFGDYNYALELFNQAVDLAPNYSRAYSNRAEFYLIFGEGMQAKPDAEKALELDETNFQAYNVLGNLAFDREDFEEALALYDKAREYYPNETTVSINAGNTLLALERYDEAIERYQAVIAYVPIIGDAHNGLARAYYMLGRYLEAIDSYTDALALSSTDQIALYGRSLSYMRVSQFSNARSDLDTLIELDADACTYNNRCVAQNGVGNYEGAVSDCTISIDNGGPVSAFFNRAVAYDRLGEVDLALDDYQIVVAYFPPDSLEAQYAQLRIEALSGNMATMSLPLSHLKPRVTTSEANQGEPFPLAVCEA